MKSCKRQVALFTRAWIEIFDILYGIKDLDVALFTRAWIEISHLSPFRLLDTGRPLHEGVD